MSNELIEVNTVLVCKVFWRGTVMAVVCGAGGIKLCDGYFELDGVDGTAID